MLKVRDAIEASTLSKRNPGTKLNSTKPFDCDATNHWGRLGVMMKVLMFALIMSSFTSTLRAQSLASVEYDNLADQLAELAGAAGIEIKRLELAEKFPPKKVYGRLPQKVTQLLSDFNYTIVQTPGQAIERIIIVGRKRHGPRRTVLHTRRHGKNHVIQAVITGVNGYFQEVSLVVDTGADYIVLPRSMMESLGLREDATTMNTLQTANGVIDALIGRLSELRIGNETISNIEVAFIEDSQLGGAKLLGMNVLKRYRFTLDDKRQTITLIKAD